MTTPTTPTTPTITKTCPKCKQTKDINDYHISTTRPDGHQATCKSCYKTYHNANYLRDTLRMMVGRCNNPNHQSYRYYGARGITVYQPWQDDYNRFVNYVMDVLGPRPSKKHSIDRINNNYGYQPDNIRWATQTSQIRNRSNTVYVTLPDGSQIPAKAYYNDHKDSINVTYDTFRIRIQRGQSIQEASR